MACAISCYLIAPMKSLYSTQWLALMGSHRLLHVNDSISQQRSSGVFHLSISTNPEDGKVSKMQSDKQKYNNNTSGNWKCKIQMHEISWSVPRHELGAPAADQHSWAKTDLNGSCKNPWIFSKVMVIHLTIPINYLLKDHASTETISSQINGLTLMITELLPQPSKAFKSFPCFMRQEVEI